MRGFDIITLVRHFEVRFEFVGTFGHAIEEAFLNSLVNAEAKE